MTRHHVLRIVAVLMLCCALIPPTTGESRALAQTSQLNENAPEGVTVDPLAIASFDSFVVGSRENLIILLVRVPIDPGETVDMRSGEEVEAGLGGDADAYAFHDHLLYVESGEVVLSDTGGDDVLQVGSQEIQPKGSPYSIRNDSPDCASVLRLSAGTIGGRAGPGTSTEVPNLPVSCGEPVVILSTFGPNPAATLGTPTLLFLARTTWVKEPKVFIIEWTHTGPTAILVESGTLLIQENPDKLNTTIRLSEGSGIQSRQYTTFGSTIRGDAPVETLMIGLVSADEPLWTSPHYVGQVFPFRLAWDGTWRISEEYRRPGSYEYFQATHYQSGDIVSLEVLNAGHSDTYEPFDVDPAGCVDEAAALLGDDPHVDNIQPLLETAPRLPVAGDDPGTRALYSYIYTDDLGDEFVEVMYVECRAIEPDNITMKVTSYMARDDLENHVATIQSLLDGLVIPYRP